MMALQYRFPGNTLSEIDVARQCKCVPSAGCAVMDVYRAALRYGLQPKWLDVMSIENDVETALGNGRPVIISVQLSALPYLHGQSIWWHSVVVIGMDDVHAFVHDPAPDGGERLSVRRDRLLAAWDSSLFSAYSISSGASNE